MGKPILIVRITDDDVHSEIAKNIVEGFNSMSNDKYEVFAILANKEMHDKIKFEYHNGN